ncbi:hypothetical protein LshimejAT787_0310330 [Lyophyllum shimeji]|uniref:Protein BCP1 n=1 Tax=Lyophyllum shimeji TaxID=47721 RepID=A0A9P3UMW9_LYOSH|nr:hypothetical protein LshimejAT787_0310330 [Lyophyllum shimeji]
MSKRKQSAGDESDDSSSDVSLIDVDFDFFDPNPKVDYQALKRLLRQLFQRDADIFQLHELAELILSQPTVGTTIKTDGIESDPYAFLTVLNMHVHHEHSSIKAIANYALQKSSADPAFHATLQTLFSQNQRHVGFVFCERLINMPVQVVPPMYNMLTKEMQWAVDDNEPYTFSHYLFISRTYRLTPEEESALLNSAPQTKAPSSKKSKKTNAATQPVPTTSPDGIYPYHPEDEYIKLASVHTVDYQFTNAAEPREKDSFGLDTRGRMMLLPAERFPALHTRLLLVRDAKSSFVSHSNHSQVPTTSMPASSSSPDAATDTTPLLSKETNRRRKATYAMRDKTLKILEKKSRLKKTVTFAKLTGGGSDLEGTIGVMFFEIGDKESNHDAPPGLLAAGVRAQQKRKAAGVRRLRRRYEELEPAGSTVKSRVNSGDEAASDHASAVKSVAASVPVIPRSIHAMSTRRSSKLGGFEASG